VDELLPVLVARVSNRREAVPALEAALRRGLAFLILDEPPSYDGPHALELHVPEWTEPVLLMAEPAGDPLGNEYPLALRPFAEEHVEVLAGLLADMGIEPPDLSPAEPPLVALHLDDAPLVDLSLSEPPPPAPEVHYSELPEARLSELPEERTSMLPGGLVGRTLGGKYYIENLLGSGGMGDVYQATHLALRKPIAVKVLHPSHRHNEEFLVAFHREALAASRLDHANVVQVIDFGHEQDGLLYIVMELLNGTDLRAVLDRQPVQPLERIVEVMTQVAAALSASHDQGVIHRDVKPENVILVPKRDDDGTVRDFVKVCDFGIAEIVERGAHLPGEGKTAEVAGTPDYMSPEQVRGGDIDARADLYGCGVILYEMATGKVPFHAEETAEQIAWAHVQKEPPPPSALNPGVDRRLEALILKAMAKDPDRRHQDARELRADLRAVLEASRRARGLQSFTEDDDAVPLGVVPQFEREDAIDIGDLFAMDPVAPAQPGTVKEQIWVLSERMATALLQDPGAVFASLEALRDDADYARDMSTLERAMASVAQRGGGGAPALLAAVTHLTARARGVAPGERTREAVAARVLRTFARPELLLRIAEEALDGPPAAREPARKLLVTVGAAGAHALAAARERASAQGPSWAGRPRFVAALREIGAAAALPALISFLQQADARDAALLEDFLRAVPEGRPQDARAVDPASETLGTLLSTVHIRHPAAAVRRAAVTALASVWGPRANAWLVPLLEDADDGLRMAALAALRRHGGVDRELVRRLERLLLVNPTATSADLRVSAAAALGDATAAARPAAVEALTQALRPQASGSFLAKLVTVEVRDEPEILATMAQALLHLGAPEAARVIEARAARSTGETRQRLLDVLARAR
jgi:serine/threonine-protein kinase